MTSPITIARQLCKTYGVETPDSPFGKKAHSSEGIAELQAQLQDTHQKFKKLTYEDMDIRIGMPAPATNLPSAAVPLFEELMGLAASIVIGTKLFTAVTATPRPEPAPTVIPDWIQRAIDDYLKLIGDPALSDEMKEALAWDYLKTYLKQMGLLEIVIPDDILLSHTETLSTPQKATGHVHAVVASVAGTQTSSADPNAKSPERRDKKVERLMGSLDDAASIRLGRNTNEESVAITAVVQGMAVFRPDGISAEEWRRVTRVCVSKWIKGGEQLDEELWQPLAEGVGEKFRRFKELHLTPFLILDSIHRHGVDIVERLLKKGYSRTINLQALQMEAPVQAAALIDEAFRAALVATMGHPDSDIRNNASTIANSVIRHRTLWAGNGMELAEQIIAAYQAARDTAEKNPNPLVREKAKVIAYSAAKRGIQGEENGVAHANEVSEAFLAGRRIAKLHPNPRVQKIAPTIAHQIAASGIRGVQSGEDAAHAIIAAYEAALTVAETYPDPKIQRQASTIANRIITLGGRGKEKGARIAKKIIKSILADPADTPGMDPQIAGLMGYLSNGTGTRSGNYSAKEAPSARRIVDALSVHCPEGMSKKEWRAIVTICAAKWVKGAGIRESLLLQITSDQWQALAGALDDKFRALINAGLHSSLALNIMHRHAAHVVTTLQQRGYSKTVIDAALYTDSPLEAAPGIVRAANAARRVALKSRNPLVRKIASTIGTSAASRGIQGAEAGREFASEVIRASQAARRVAEDHSSDPIRDIAPTIAVSAANRGLQGAEAGRNFASEVILAAQAARRVAENHRHRQVRDKAASIAAIAASRGIRGEQNGIAFAYRAIEKILKGRFVR